MTCIIVVSMVSVSDPIIAFALQDGPVLTAVKCKLYPQSVRLFNPCCSLRLIKPESISILLRNGRKWG